VEHEAATNCGEKWAREEATADAIVGEKPCVMEEATAGAMMGEKPCAMVRRMTVECPSKGW
jgi:hypothetical protein